MRRVLTRIFLIVAFLAAQTAGVAHQVWHDAGAQAVLGANEAGIHGAGDGKAPKKNLLCDFHSALGSVLGALASAHAPLEAGFQETTRFAAAESGAARFSLLASRSRGPPAFL